MKTFRLLLAAALFAIPVSATAGSDTRVLVANLLGGNELPVLGDPDAFGVATVTLATPALICYSIVLQNGTPPNAAHIHTGTAGAAGAISLALPLPAAVPARFANCIAAPAALVTAIRNNPQGFYVNVHSVAFPGGMARGQLQ